VGILGGVKQCATVARITKSRPGKGPTADITGLILALFESALDVLLARTGRKALSLFGRKSNLLVEVLVGLVVWVAMGMLLLAAIGAHWGAP